MDAVKDKVTNSPMVKQMLMSIEQTAVMNYVSKFLSNFKEFYNEINSATLTGAIDVVVIRLEDGSYACSPFHVRFGKIGVLRSREKVVDIEINGEQIAIHMKLGESGEAFFVEETEDPDDDVPSHLATSPIPSYDIEKAWAKRSAKEAHSAPGYIHSKNNHDVYVQNENMPTTLSDITDGFHQKSHKRDSSTSKNNWSVPLTNDRPSPATNLSTKLINQGRVSVSEGMLTLDLDRRANRLDLTESSDPGLNVLRSHSSSDGLVADTSGKSLSKFLQTSVSEQVGGVDEDKLKAKKKRRKRSVIRKRKEREMSAAQTSSANKDSSDDEPEEIFQMDVDEEGDDGNANQSNSSSVSLINRKSIPINNSGPSHVNDVSNFKSSSVQTREIAPTCSPVSSHSWPYKQTLPLNLEIHPFSDGDVTPVLSPVASRPPTPKSDTEYEIQKQETASQTETGDNRWSWTWGELPVPPKTHSEKQGKENAVSDDEGIHPKRMEQDSDEHRSMLGGMFRFMRKTKKIRHQPESEGIYLDDLNPDEMDPEVAKLYFPPRSSSLHLQNAADMKRSSVHMKDEDVESGNGSSLPQSPYSTEGGLGSMHGIDSDTDDRHPMFDFKGHNDLAISLCGGLADSDGVIPEERFLQTIVTYDEFCEHPEMLDNPELVIRLNNKYYNWQTVAPMVLSMILYQRSLPDKTINNLIKQHMPKKQKKSETKGYSLWWTSWRRPTNPEEEGSKQEVHKKLSIDETAKISPTKPESEAKISSTKPESEAKISSTKPESEAKISPTKPESEAKISPTKPESEAKIKIEDISPTVHVEPSTPTSEKSSLLASKLETSPSKVNGVETLNVPRTEEDVVDSNTTTPEKRSFYTGNEKYKKTLRLTSEQISQLNLNDGPNEVVFSVTTAYQGTTRCKCHIYLWNHDDKIVISDIDGTITKSDVLGHILPIIGKDWAQSGVAQLFTKIKNNGYQFLYLSARAIGQAHITREYLKSVRQGDVCLPDGPLLLNPSSLISAFHREVIEKKPEEFKISCLKDIQALFPLTSTNPFYAGYGNRVNDVWAYRAVGIPMSRIFTINHKGELKHELTQTFQSTYSGLTYVVDHLFPPLRRSSLRDGILTSDFEGSDEFSAFTYWRQPIPEVHIDIAVSKSPEKKIDDKKSAKVPNVASAITTTSNT